MPSRRRDPYADPFQFADYTNEGRRHSRLKTILAVVGIVAAISVVAAGAAALWLNSSLSNIRKIDVAIAEENRPAPQEESSGMNILLLGADTGTARSGPGSSILKDAAAKTWPVGKYRSDATMLVHIDDDRERAYVVSIPRDSFVPLHDSTGLQRESNKINAALSLYGPAGAVSTVENFTDVRVDHLSMVDWDGFQDITDALGGVAVTLPGQGRQTLDGAAALEYVRERKTLPNGDFDRVKRQQNFLRAVTRELVDGGTLANPIKLKGPLDAITKHMAVDDEWSDGDIRSLAFAMRDLKTKDLTFVTIPTTGTSRHPVAGSIVEPDEDRCASLFKAMREDDMARWIEENPRTKLGSPGSVD